MRALSIQSHVVHGYVGNKISAFTLQLLNINTDIINTCNLSNHTGYNIYKGSFSTNEHIKDIITGLKSNNLTNYN